MARTYAKLLVSLWSDDDFLSLGGGPQRLYMALLSNPKLSTAGSIPWQPNKWANLSADGTPEQIADDLKALTAARFIMLDTRSEEVLIRSFIRHDGGANNPNLYKSITSAITAIESPALRAAANEELTKAHVTGSKPDPVPDPDEERRLGDRQEDTEPTYILKPSSLSPDPSASIPQSSSAADASGELLAEVEPSPDDDGLINKIITRCAAHLADKRIDKSGSSTGYVKSCITQMQRDERPAIAALLVAKPYMRTQPDKAADWYVKHVRPNLHATTRSA